MKKPCRKSGKVKFDTHWQALKRGGEILNEPGTEVEFLRAYRCPHCGKFHLTSRATIQQLGERTPGQPSSGASPYSDTSKSKPARIPWASDLGLA